MKKILLGLGVSLLLLGCQQANKGPASGEPIKIGGIAPLTGDAAVYGLMSQKIATLRFEEINAAGGIHGHPLEIIWEDGKCDPGESSRAAQKLVNMDKVSVILGGVCSGETLGAAPITERNKVILMSGISTSPEVTKAGDFVFRTSPSDSSQGKILGEYASKHFKKVGLLTEQTDYALGVSTVFKENFSGETAEEKYLSSESDFKTRITKLKNENVEALLIIPQSAPKEEIILKQLQEQNWTTPLLVNEISTSNLETTKKFAEFLTKNKTIGANFVAPDNAELNAFFAKFTDRFGTPLDYTNYAAGVVDAIDVLAKVLRETHDVTDTKALRDALYGLKNYEGVFGPLQFDANGDVNITFSLFEFNGTEFVPLPADATQKAASGEPITIGAITPLTGDAASYGQLVQNITNLIVEDLNAKGGIQGRPMEVIWEDGKCNPGDASRAAQKLINVDKVSIITGFSCSGELLGVAPLTKNGEAVLMGAITSSPEITHAGDFVFRTFPSDSSQGISLAEEAGKHFKNVGILVESSDYALGIADVFENSFRGAIQREEFLSSESDFKTRITKLKSEKPDALLLITQAPPKMDIILKQLQEQDWNLPVWGNEMLGNDADIVKKYGPFFQKLGSVITANFLPPENEKFNEFVSRYAQKFGETPKFIGYVGPSADSINVLIHLFQKGVDPKNSEAIRDALYNLDDFEGMNGPVKFDKNGDVGMTYTLMQFDGEKFVPLEK